MKNTELSKQCKQLSEELHYTIKSNLEKAGKEVDDYMNSGKFDEDLDEIENELPWWGKVLKFFKLI
jgi:hypothetical protein